MVTDSRGPLARQIDLLAFQFRIEHNAEATHILLPTRARSEIKDFVAALCAEIEGIGSEPQVFDRFIRAKPGDRIAEFRDLEIQTYEGDSLIVGRADQVH
jgi:hypothetical protein